jgi:hypothetical protein
MQPLLDIGYVMVLEEFNPQNRFNDSLDRSCDSAYRSRIVAALHEVQGVEQLELARTSFS